jgi:hypothetical protein
MKVFLRLAILIATLLLVANMAFAQILVCINPICYDIIATDENNNTNADSWIVCLTNDGIGSLYSNNAQTYYNLYLFGGGPGWFNTSGNPGFVNGDPNYTTWIARATNGGECQTEPGLSSVCSTISNESGFLQPIGEGSSKGDLLTGEGVRNGIRYTIQGKKVPCIIRQPI